MREVEKKMFNAVILMANVFYFTLLLLLSFLFLPVDLLTFYLQSALQSVSLLFKTYSTPYSPSLYCLKPTVRPPVRSLL